MENTIGMLFLQDQKWRNEPRTNEQRVQVTLLGDIFLGLEVSFIQAWVTFVQNKTFQIDPWKIMGWVIPSIVQEKNVMISRPKDSLLTGINKLETTQAREIDWKGILM